MGLEAVDVQCPYCGETIEIDVETSPDDQSYIEDCSVCCRPIQFTIQSLEGAPQVTATRSD